MNAFDRLSPALRYQLVNTAGIQTLRPVQEQSIEAVLAGHNCVVLAPTAGGKTEAAFFPLLSAMDTEDWKPVSVVYLSPIRALLNNQEDRVARYASLVGRRAFKWHGDVNASARKRFLADPADILLTTPESLEAMLMSQKVPSGSLFAGLRAIIVDEIHAFAADDRGSHLSAVLERLTRLAGRDVQRIGLSATVGNPETIASWVTGSSKRDAIVVDPGGARKQPQLSIDFVGSLENAARVIEHLHPGQKRLVFVDSRRKAEDIGKLLRDAGVEAFVTHGSLSVSERRDAERAFEEGRDCVIVATSALELGIDVGDLDHVLQIDAPSTVASFLQRMGRTGRREGTLPNCTFLTTTEPAALQAAALVRLQRQGWVESVAPSDRAQHIYAHQVMGLAVARQGVPRGEVDPWLSGASAFAGLETEERARVVDTMLERDILSSQEGLLWLGAAGEKRYGRANFEALYAVFQVPQMFVVIADHQEVGTVDAHFLRVVASSTKDQSFTLAGQPWEIVHIDWERGKCIVKRTANARAPRWSGAPRFLSYAVCQAMRELLVSEAVDEVWSSRAKQAMETVRAEHGFLREGRTLLERSDGVDWWTFAGGAANTLLARMLERDLGGKCVIRNHWLSLKDAPGASGLAVRELATRWLLSGSPSAADAQQLAGVAARAGLSKFEPCLPDAALHELQASRLFDVEGARNAASASRVSIALLEISASQTTVEKQRRLRGRQ